MPDGDFVKLSRVKLWAARPQQANHRIERPAKVLEMLRRLGVGPWCLRLTASGHPEHPLRLPITCGLLRFEAEVGKVGKREAPAQNPEQRSPQLARLKVAL